MKSLCQTLAKPSEANARALSNLFPTTRKRKFDPLNLAANTESKNKKKGFPHRERSKVISVIILEVNSNIIPRGTARDNSGTMIASKMYLSLSILHMLK